MQQMDSDEVKARERRRFLAGITPWQRILNSILALSGGRSSLSGFFAKAGRFQRLSI